jgi:hypothetical protein
MAPGSPAAGLAASQNARGHHATWGLTKGVSAGGGVVVTDARDRSTRAGDHVERSALAWRLLVALVSRCLVPVVAVLAVLALAPDAAGAQVGPGAQRPTWPGGQQ